MYITLLSKTTVAFPLTASQGQDIGIINKRRVAEIVRRV